jgi:hypothetical protein
MKKMQDVVALLRKEHARLTKQVEGIGAALAAFGNSYQNRTGTRKISLQVVPELRPPKERDGQSRRQNLDHRRIGRCQSLRERKLQPHNAHVGRKLRRLPD